MSVGKPLIESAAINALGPGILSTIYPSSDDIIDKIEIVNSQEFAEFIFTLNEMETITETSKGQDENELGSLAHEEFENLDNWKGRSWKVGSITLNLRQFNGHFQLYIDIPNNDKDESTAGNNVYSA